MPELDETNDTRAYNSKIGNRSFVRSEPNPIYEDWYRIRVSTKIGAFSMLDKQKTKAVSSANSSTKVNEILTIDNTTTHSISMSSMVDSSTCQVIGLLAIQVPLIPRV